MQTPPSPPDEASRLEALRALSLLDTDPEERFDRLTRLARRLFGAPIALVTLVDANRQWFKSREGLEPRETAREISFCGHAILGDGVMLVPDAARDERFHDNPLVTGEPGIRFYAGYPLSLADGSRAGTLCIIDRKPRDFGEEDVALLRDLGEMVERELAAVHLATMDELTQLSNRRGFDALSRHALGLCRRTGTPATLLFVDLDRFKQINDRFGHAEGDRALATFARLVKETFRDTDVLGRIGGDEFAVLATGSGPGAVDAMLARLRRAVELHNGSMPEGFALGFSAGLVEFDAARHGDVAAMMEEADSLMYERKRGGGKLAAPAA